MCGLSGSSANDQSMPRGAPGVPAGIAPNAGLLLGFVVDTMADKATYVRTCRWLRRSIGGRPRGFDFRGFDAACKATVCQLPLASQAQWCTRRSGSRQVLGLLQMAAGLWDGWNLSDDVLLLMMTTVMLMHDDIGGQLHAIYPARRSMQSTHGAASQNANDAYI